MLAGFIGCHLCDDAMFRQLRYDIVPFSICIRIGGVGDLEGQLGQATGCGFPALRGWASANDQAKTRECRLDAMIL